MLHDGGQQVIGQGMPEVHDPPLSRDQETRTVDRIGAAFQQRP